MNESKKEKWDLFITEHKGCFLQSWQWGEFQKEVGREVWPIEIGKDLKALVFKYKLSSAKNYLYCPRGPIIKQAGISETEQVTNSEAMKLFLKEVKLIAKQQNSIFFKIEPSDKSHFLKKFFSQSDNEFVKSQKEVQVSETLVLDMNKSEQELLSQMHPKTRYNIKLAQRKGIIIQQADPTDQLSIGVFWELLQKTAKRDSFHTHLREYYLKMWHILGKQGMIRLFLARYQDQIIAANLVCFFGYKAVYLHGASDYKYHNLMAPYLLQWHAILRTKEIGFRYYDFWGINEKKWPGITRFKKGFTDQRIIYPGAFDLVFQPIWYQTYKIARRIL